MPYVGRGLTTGAQYQKLDAIAINNATTFTMSVGSANVSPDQNHLILVVNGVIQEPGTGFTVAGSTCTLASAITTSGHSGTDTIYGVIAGDAAFAAYDSIGANALGVTAGTVTASRAIVPDSNKDIASFRNVTLTGELDAATLDISGNADIDGTTNLDAVDIDGAVQVDNTITVGANDQGYDVKFFGDTASAYMLWDTSADDLVFAGAAGIDLAGDIDVDGTANLDVVDIDGAVDMASTLTLAGNADFKGDLDVDGTTNLDAVDIDGAVQIDNTVTVGVDDTGHDVKFFGATATNGYMLWDESTDDLILGSSSKLGIGTDSPGSPLDVESSLAANTANFNSTNGATNITLKSSGTLIGQIEFTSGGDCAILTRTSSASLALGSNNVKTLYITDDDRVGIGVTAPEQPLDVLGSVRIRSTASNEDRFLLNPGGAGDDAILKMYNNAETNNIHLDASSGKLYYTGGKLGIATDTVTGLLTVYAGNQTAHTNAASGLFISNGTGADCVGQVGFGPNGGTNPAAYYGYLQTSGTGSTNGALILATRAGTGDDLPSERMRIDTDGVLTLNANKNGACALFKNAGNATSQDGIEVWFGKNDGTGTNTAFIANDGDGTNTGVLKTVGGTFQLADTSDIRLKENIKDTTIKGIETVDKIKVRDFDWKKSGETVVGGLVANELKEVYSQAVDGDSDAVYDDGKIKPMTVSRDVLVPLLVKAVQELTAKVEALENA